MKLQVLTTLVCVSLSSVALAKDLPIAQTQSSAVVAQSIKLQSTNIMTSVDSDGDGLPNSLDRCPQADDWFLVPRDKLGKDQNQVEDADGITEDVRTTQHLESAQDVTDAINDFNNDSSPHPGKSADDLGEELSIITLLYILDGGSDYIYDRAFGINNLAETNKMQASNYGDSYIVDAYVVSGSYGNGDAYDYYSGGDGTEDGPEFSNSKVIAADTDFVGVIQKNCKSIDAKVFDGPTKGGNDKQNSKDMYYRVD